MTQIINYSLPLGDRISMREYLIQAFLRETPGTGIGDNASRYQYNVEQFGDYSIFLKRPTQLNKGFDFTVNIGGLFFKRNRRYSNPSHQDIIDALTPVLLTPSGATFCDYAGNEHPIEIVLLAVKWLFMEQDCAYWNYSGRAMFYGVLQENELI